MKTKVWIVPHTHYDAEVFITEAETLDIGYANILGALEVLRRDPKFRFVLDQTCYIGPFLKNFPEQRPFFQQMVNEGRLEIAGGMYIMPDVNIPSGESFIRQVLAGKRYCEKELNVDVRCGWTIDTFGHHPQIPQLMAKCGFDHNIFQRVREKGSKTEFYWKGLDGTRLFCHWMPAGYCVFYFSPSNLRDFKRYAENRIRMLKSQAVTRNILALAGADITPVEAHIVRMAEEYNRSQDESELVVATPAEFFDAVKKSGKFPTIDGDLNPLFQGTYSARIEVKQWNRRLENLLVSCERYEAIAAQLGAGDRRARIEDAWKGVLFNQFHDIICGCHVDKVFVNTMDRFKQSSVMVNECLENRLQAITDQIDTEGDGVPVVVFNPLSWDRTDPVEVTVGFTGEDVHEIEVRDSSGVLIPSDMVRMERHANGAIRRAGVLFIAKNVPASGYEVYRIVTAVGKAPATDVKTSQPYADLRGDLNAGYLENAFYRVDLDLWTGLITGIYDKVNKWQVLPDDMKCGNMIVKEQDYGNFWQYNGPCKGDTFNPVRTRYPLPPFNSRQADFAHNYDGDGWIRNGNVFVEMTIGHPFATGQFSTRVRLYAGLPRIEIVTTLTNNDERVRYRAAFPTSIKGGTITHEIPFGAIKRPEGEYPAQNWMDYNKGGRGVALLNKGLPGNNVADGVMMLSLLKCTGIKEGYGESGGFKLSTPTDMGYEKGKTHVFDYALVPHKGDWRQAALVRRGAEFNAPLIPVKVAKKAGKLRPKMSFARVSKGNVIVSAVKSCDGGMIVRVYESEGRKTRGVTLDLAWPIVQAAETDLVEKVLKPVPLGKKSGRMTFDIGAFEIKTFRLVLRP